MITFSLFFFSNSCRGHYNVYLQCITVHERILPIDPVTFATSRDGETMIDSDTSLVYLVTEAYDSVVTDISILLINCSILISIHKYIVTSWNVFLLLY